MKGSCAAAGKVCEAGEVGRKGPPSTADIGQTRVQTLNGYIKAETWYSHLRPALSPPPSREYLELALSRSTSLTLPSGRTTRRVEGRSLQCATKEHKDLRVLTRMYAVVVTTCQKRPRPLANLVLDGLRPL